VWAAHASQVVDSPEVLTAIGATPHLKDFLNALYGCQYMDFFKVAACVREQKQTIALGLPPSCTLCR
jgi:hypothetical protein